MEPFDPFHEQWNRWPAETVKFFFTQSEAKLKNMIEVGRRTADRAYALLTTATSLFVIVIAYLVKSMVDHNGSQVLIWLSWSTGIVLFFVIMILMKLLFPRDVYPLGKDPRYLIVPSFLQPGYEDDDIIKAVILSECQSNQNSIDHNEQDNIRRLRLLKLALWLIIFILPLSCLIVFLYQMVVP